MTIVIILSVSFSPNILAENKNFETDISNLTYYNDGFRYNIRGWIFLHIEGEPYERGLQYGYLAADEIIDIIYRWCEWSNKGRTLKIKTLENKEEIWNLYKDKAKQLFLKQIPQEYLREMEGIVDGINSKNTKLFDRQLEREDILTLQLFQDIHYSCFKYPLKVFHPLENILSGFKNFISKLFDSSDEHCIAFIATGSATKSGEIVAAHSTIFYPAIAQKCNFVIDFEPAEGHRFIMTTFPGAIWSCEDYYQNEEGIILTETELPQGPWNRDGAPKGVRSRNAIQYSSSIDQVITYLMDGNNGLIPNEWLIGDIKTGEIASLEQALYNTPTKRTYDGFYWSCNFPHSSSVKRELYGIPSILIDIATRAFPRIILFAKIRKFAEIEKDFYGKIDIDVAKEILSTPVLSQGLTDGKITTSKLMKNMSLFTHLGNPDGNTIKISRGFEGDDLIIDFPAFGWIQINPSSMIIENINDIDAQEFNNKDNRFSNKSNNMLILFLLISLAFLSIILIHKYPKRRNRK